MTKLLQYIFMICIISIYPINASQVDCPDDQTISIISPRPEQIPSEDVKILTLRQFIPEEYRSFFNKASLAFILTSSVLGNVSTLSFVIGGLPLEFHQACSIISGTTLGILTLNFVLENVRIETRTTQTSETG